MIRLQPESDRRLFESAFAFATRQVGGTVEREPDFYPCYTREGRWTHAGAPPPLSCEGFLPGLLWLLYGHEAQAGSPGAEWWSTQAIRYSKPLEKRKWDGSVPDLGLVMMPSYYRWFQAARDPALKAAVVEAGRTAASRFRTQGGFLPGCDSEALSVESMLSLDIAFLAALELRDDGLIERAMRHALLTRRCLVRGDGSTAELAMFGPGGDLAGWRSEQGHSAGSCWSRGLAGCMYGFAAAYSYVLEPRFLATAESCADFYISSTGPDGVPPWDFDAPADSRNLTDTSAAAIAASALLQLAGISPDPMKTHLYTETALRILGVLCREHLAEGDPAWEGILKGGVCGRAGEVAAGESVIWGDYYFIEALERALRI